ncbi:MAG: nitroreductase family protein [Dialister sp.]|nr:nitroreductase family protein [Dialister sp.]
MIEEIRSRRSVRRFLQKPVPETVLKEILTAAAWAPSEKNEQPWKFIVIRGEERRAMVRALKAGISRCRAKDPSAIFSDGYDQFIPSAIYTARILEQAPVIVFVMNTKGIDYHETLPPDKSMMVLADIQSVSAAIQNLCLEAKAQGVGSLWTNNIFFAYDELKEWIRSDGEMVAAVALGYTDRDAAPTPRKPLEDVTEYRGEYPKEWLTEESKE